MNITQTLVTKIRPYENNPRLNDAAVDAVAMSISTFGFRQPIVVDADGVIICGHTRYKAALKLGLAKVPVHVAKDLTPDQIKAYRIADNHAASIAEWDLDLLPLELADLNTVDFQSPELDAMLAELADLNQPETPADVTEDDAPEPPVDPITKPGDLWLLGDHRLLCGDSTKADDVARLMGGKRAGLMFTSPPYGQQRDYGKANKMVRDWDKLMQGVFQHAATVMEPDGQILVNLGLIHRDGEWVPYWDGWIAWMREQGWRRFGWYVWDKKSPLPMRDAGRLLPQHEWVFHFNKLAVDCEKTIPCATAGTETGYGLKAKSGKQGDLGRDVTRSHRVLGSVVQAAQNEGGPQNHPAVMSVGLPVQFIQVWKGIVYEPFCGSGTTLVAAEQLRRVCFSMELDPAYCDVIVQRWEKLTGGKAKLET